VKRFRFPLERVERIRQLQAEVERARLEQLVQEQARLDATERHLLSQRDAMVQSTAHAVALTGSDLNWLDDFQFYVRREQMRLGQMRVALRPRIAAQFQKRFEAERQVKLLGRLRSKQQAAWTAAEVKELQELAEDSHQSRLARERVPRPEES
jgi:hypothetical protein